MIPLPGGETVDAACAESLNAGIASADVVLNALSRLKPAAPVAPIQTPERLVLTIPPLADCGRYDTLRAPAIAVEVYCGAV